jgi:hypothetical protein
MKTFLKYTFLATAIAGFVGIAHAVPTLRIIDVATAQTIEIADGSALDTSPVAGMVMWSGPLGAWTLNFDTGLTYPAIGSPSDPQMDLSFGAYTPTGGTLKIYFSEVGFTAPGTASVDIGGTKQGSTVAFGTFGGTSNSLFDYSISNRLTLLQNGALVYNGLTFSGSASGGSVGGSVPYSLTEFIQITQTGAGLTTGDAMLTVPDGGTTALLVGLGLLGLSAFARRRKVTRA